MEPGRARSRPEHPRPTSYDDRDVRRKAILPTLGLPRPPIRGRYGTSTVARPSRWQVPTVAESWRWPATVHAKPGYRSVVKPGWWPGRCAVFADRVESPSRFRGPGRPVRRLPATPVQLGAIDPAGRGHGTVDAATPPPGPGAGPGPRPRAARRDAPGGCGRNPPGRSALARADTAAAPSWRSPRRPGSPTPWPGTTTPPTRLRDQWRRGQAENYLEFLSEEEIACRVQAAQDLLPFDPKDRLSSLGLQECPVCDQETLLAEHLDDFGMGIGAGTCFVCGYCRSTAMVDDEALRFMWSNKWEHE